MPGAWCALMVEVAEASLTEPVIPVMRYWPAPSAVAVKVPEPQKSDPEKLKSKVSAKAEDAGSMASASAPRAREKRFIGSSPFLQLDCFFELLSRMQSGFHL